MRENIKVFLRKLSAVFCLWLVAKVFLYVDAQYVPGEPGAPWTVEEMNAVRPKIHKAINDGQALWKSLGYPQFDEAWTSTPTAGKLLRLGFHDCAKYADGTGGCDGCLDWRGVGHRYKRADLQKGIYNMSVQGFHNGLGPTVQLLEEIYTREDFPPGTQRLSPSLQQRGKSRADLWQFASIVAVEYSVALNNIICDNPELGKVIHEQCHPRDGLSDCKVQLPRPFKFATGRRDCISNGAPWENLTSMHSYKAAEDEVHPSSFFNGPQVVQFMKDYFGVNGRETVALMGAHTIGRVFVTNTLMRYSWKTRSEKLFNNGYFRNMAKKHDWYYPTDTELCTKVGGANGERPQARWVPHVRGDLPSGGPVQWLQEKLVCPWSTTTNSTPTCSSSDLRWRFVVGIDEQMLNSDIGLYFDFPVDDDGLPYGCPGFEQFNMASWGNSFPFGGLNNYHLTWTRINGEKAEPLCNFTTISDPEDSMPLHEIVEEYANDGAKFIQDFVAAYEKISTNGYCEEELEDSPTEGMLNWADIPHVACGKCYQPRDTNHCVAKAEQSVYCYGCVKNDNSWHCPAGQGCLGQNCQDEPAPPISSSENTTIVSSRRRVRCMSSARSSTATSSTATSSTATTSAASGLVSSTTTEDTTPFLAGRAANANIAFGSLGMRFAYTAIVVASNLLFS